MFSIILCLSLVILVGGGRRHLHCLRSDIQWWPMPECAGALSCSNCYLCGFRTMERPRYRALPVDSELQLSSPFMETMLVL